MSLFDISWLFGYEQVSITQLSRDKLLSSIKMKIDKIDMQITTINKNIENINLTNEINVDAVELSIMVGLILTEQKNTNEFKKISANCNDILEDMTQKVNEKLNSEYLKLLQLKSRRDSLDRIHKNLVKSFEAKPIA